MEEKLNEDQTTVKLMVETVAECHQTSDTSVKSLLQDVEADSLTRSPTPDLGLDLMQSSIACTSGSKEQRAYPPPSDAGATAVSPPAFVDQPEMLKPFVVHFSDLPTGQAPVDPDEISVADYRKQ